MLPRRIRLAAALWVPALATAARAQTLDRTLAPTPGPMPAIVIPRWTRSTLANGAELIVTPKHDLPLVAVSITFVGGADNYEPAGKDGTATFAAQMLSEGTTTRSADQLSDAQQLLGTQIVVGVGGESGQVTFESLADHWEDALGLAADMLEHSTFPAPALDRIRGRTLVQLAQSRDQPNAIASNVFAVTLYGDAHPYGRVLTKETIQAITRDDVVAFATRYFEPGRAVVTVTGDVQPAAAKAAVERVLGGWHKGGARPDWKYPAVAAPRATTIYLVDKPKAAQSVFAIGLPGPPRDTPDYFAILVMNNLLGGLFQSRLNHDIREVKGYSYGVFSTFAFGRGPGAFRAGGGIVTAKTDSALIAFMTQFRGVLGAAPFSADEIAQSKANLIQSLPRRFASVASTGASVAAIYVQGLSPTYYQEFAAHVNAVTPADLLRVAKRYIDLEHLAIVIVADRAAVEQALGATNVAPIVRLDVDGKPVPAGN
jgi:zinc protease